MPEAPHDGSAADARAFVGMGSNLGDRLATMRAATDSLRRRVPNTTVLAASSVYETRPLGPSEGLYLNAVVLLQTTLGPRSLLAALLDLELAHGRRRTHHWGARTLDLDLLLYVLPGSDHSLWIDALNLRLPHPELAHRDFALAPLAELDDNVAVHAGLKASALLQALPAARRTISRRLDEKLL